MKHGCMVMTLRLSSSRRSGKSPNSPRLKKACEVRSNVKSMLIIFFDIQGIVRKVFIRPGQTVNGKFYCEVLKRLREAFDANVQTSGRNTIGFSNMTMRPLTHHSLFDNSWLPKILQWFPTPPIRLTSPSATFSYSPRWNYRWTGVVLTRMRRSTQKRKRLSTHSHLRTHRGAWNHGNMLGLLYTCPRGLLRRKRWKLGITVRNFFLWSNSLNFWVTPSTFVFTLAQNVSNHLVHP